MRRLLPAAAAATALLAPLAPPAHAAGSVVLTCTVHYSGGTGTAECTAAGIVGTAVVSGAVHLNFSTQPNCPGATAVGSASGALNLAFVLTRVGPTGVVTTTGDINGAGLAQFSQPCQLITGSEIMVWELAGL